MKRFLIGAAILALAIGSTETASARGGHRGGGGSSYSRPVSYRSSAFNGYYYKGRTSTFWNHRYWYPSYGCYLYWNPAYNAYYYWCAPDGCYYPISYSPYGRFAW